jgi:hypothetical protein
VSELAVVPERLDEAGAKKLHARIKTEIRTMEKGFDTFKGLLVQAKAGEIHRALGYPSWTAYVATEFKGVWRADTIDARLEIVALLAGEGFSVRAIAAVTGTKKSQAGRDLAAVPSGTVSDTVTTLNNKLMARRKNTITIKDEPPKNLDEPFTVAKQPAPSGTRVTTDNDPLPVTQREVSGALLSLNCAMGTIRALRSRAASQKQEDVVAELDEIVSKFCVVTA